MERIAGALVAVAIVGGARAQEKVDWITPSEKGEFHYDVDWPGGTLEMFAKGADAVADEVTVLPAAGADRLYMPAIELEGIDMTELMWLPWNVFSYQVNVNDSTNHEETVKAQIEQGETVRFNYVIAEGAHERFGIDQQERRFDVDFPGGTVEEYVDAVHESAGEKKIVLTPEAARVEMPKVEVTNIVLADAVELITNVTGMLIYSSGDIRIVREPSRISPTAQGHPSKDYESNSWPIEAYTGEHMLIEDLLSSVDAAVELVGGETRIRFHKGSGVLMARGPDKELDMIDDVLASAKQLKQLSVFQKAMERDKSGDGRKQRR